MDLDPKHTASDDLCQVSANGSYEINSSYEDSCHTPVLFVRSLTNNFDHNDSDSVYIKTKADIESTPAAETIICRSAS